MRVVGLASSTAVYFPCASSGEAIKQTIRSPRLSNSRMRTGVRDPSSATKRAVIDPAWCESPECSNSKHNSQEGPATLAESVNWTVTGSGPRSNASPDKRGDRSHATSTTPIVVISSRRGVGRIGIMARSTSAAGHGARDLPRAAVWLGSRSGKHYPHQRQSPRISPYSTN